MLDNKKQHKYIQSKLEMTDHLTESKVVNVRCFSFLSIQVYETQLGFNAVVSNKVCLLRDEESYDSRNLITLPRLRGYDMSCNRQTKKNVICG